MPWIYTTRNIGTGGAELPGTVFWSSPQTVLPAASSEFHRVWPREEGSDAYTLVSQPSKAFYAPLGRVYYVGGHTQNMMFTEAKHFIVQTLLPPTLAWGVSAVAGPGVTGPFVGYISYWDQTHRRRSPLSAGSATLNLVDQQRSWTLPTKGFPSEFISHIELWVSADGQTPRLAARVERGLATFVEATPTLSLGEAFSEPFTDFPVCKFNAVWNYRQVMAGDAQHPDRIYLSLLGEPEKYGGFFLRTLDGYPVTGMVALRDVLLIGTARSTMRVVGFTDDDIEIQYHDPGVGLISHHMISNFHDYALWPSSQQPYLATGSSMHPLGRDFAETWRSVYRGNQAEWETRAWALNDPEKEVLLVNVNSPITRDGEKFSDNDKGRWVLDYRSVIPETGGGYSQPDLMVDVENRQVNCAGALGTEDGRRSWVFLGGEDGIVRRYNSETNFNDDSDTYGKKLTIRSGHDYYLDEGGDLDDGSKLLSLWSHVISEAAGYTINLYGGDDRAFLTNPPSLVEAVAAGAATDPFTGNPLVPKAIHYSEPMLAGRGFSMEWVQVNGILRWAGFGVRVEPGQNARGVITP